MSTIAKYPFYTALTHLLDIYGIELEEDLFETYAFIAWKLIGNLRSKMYRGKLYPTEDGEGNYFARIPCNAIIIESITTNYEDSQTTNTISNSIPPIKSSIEDNIESFKYDDNALYQSGKLVHYELTGDFIYFNEPYSELNILYKGVISDDDGLPYLSLKEVDAIAAYCAYSHLYKKSLATMDNNTLQMSLLLELKWLKKCTLARTPEYISQNEMNDILDAKTSWDRKVYGLSYKPVIN